MMFSSNVLKGWSFQKKKKMHWNMIFFVIFGKMVFLFYRKYDFFSLDRSSPEKIHLRVTFPASLKNMIFILENMVSLLK